MFVALDSNVLENEIIIGNMELSIGDILKKLDFETRICVMKIRKKRKYQNDRNCQRI